MSARTRVSIFILLVLGLHAIPVLSYQGVRQTRWPILLWAMYAQSYPAGPIEAFTRQLVVTSRRGTSRTVTYRDLGLSAPGFSSNFLQPFSRGDTSVARAMVERLNQNEPDSVAEIRLVTIRSRLVDSGIAVDTLPPVVYPAMPPAAR